MNYRTAVLIDGLASGDADLAEIFNLKGLTPISELVVTYRAPNVNAVPVAHPATLITQILVIDGSEVIYALSGKQAQALSYYHYKQPTVNGLIYSSGSSCWATCRIPFGRWLWDPMLALDPARFNNLQVIIMTDHDGGGCTPVSGFLELQANVFDAKKITPIGYLKAREHYRYLCVASGVETIDLPVDLPIKMLMLQGDVVGTNMWDQINRVRISEDLDAKVLVNNNMTDIMKALSPDLPMLVEKMSCTGTVAPVAHYITPFYEQSVVGGGGDNVVNYASFTFPLGGQTFLDAFAAGAVEAVVMGFAPHGCVGLEFGDPWDYDDWYNLSNVKSLKAYLTASAAANAAGVNKVVVQQLKKY